VKIDHLFPSALQLHRYLLSKYWTGNALIGPDPGIRLNYRVGRFIKSYLSSIKWNDNYYYLQAQGYWILANWQLFNRTGEGSYREIALKCSAYMLKQQQEDGAWLYPNPEWRGRVATAEGTWGVLGLLESYRQTADPEILAGILRWHKFLIEVTGFQVQGNELAINYFANRDGMRVPNNSIFVLRFFLELAAVLNDESYLQPAEGMLNFLCAVQQPNGEFPYGVAENASTAQRLHFQCYQYHAFACLDLLRYYELRHETPVRSLLTKVLGFLRSGIATDGHALYECGNYHRQVTYHAAALAAAFARAAQLEVADVSGLAMRAYSYVLQQQEPDGSFPHSRHDYYVLRDRRTYPRYLSMILYHLLLSGSALTNATNRKERAHVTEC
jgi:hypothetical protein